MNNFIVILQIFVLNVMRSPEIVENLPGNGRATVKEGNEIRLSCAAIGNPPPTIKWQRKDRKRMKIKRRNGNIIQSKFRKIIEVIIGLGFLEENSILLDICSTKRTIIISHTNLL